MKIDDALLIALGGAVGWTLMLFAVAGALERKPWFNRLWGSVVVVWLVFCFIMWRLS